MKYLYVSVLLYLGFFSAPIMAADNLLVVSLDGLRWQEVFRGYQDDVLNLEDFDGKRKAIEQEFAGNTAQEKRNKLLPFLWQVVAKQGILLGDRDNHSSMQLTNTFWFSYPGYNELLTGKADPQIDSNHASDNVNVTFLEWLNGQSGFQKQVAAFASWDVFPAIINRKRSKIPINAGFESAAWPNLSDKAKWLNALQKQIPSPWHNVRLDAFTAGFAQEYILQHQPKVIYLALGETDDFAHQGNYPEYLRGAKRADQFIANIWELLQSIEQYQGNTNLVITVDHGRGNSAKTWQHHASVKAIKGYLNGLNHFKSGIPGADQVWLAAMGPDVKSSLDIKQQQNLSLNQVAATAIQLLNLDYQQYSTDIGQPLPIVKQR